MNRKPTRQLCANAGCPRPASPGDLFCETCGLERSLYRREERGGPRVARTLGAAPSPQERLDRIARQPD